MIDFSYSHSYKRFQTPWYRLFSSTGEYVGANFIIYKEKEDDEPTVEISSVYTSRVEKIKYSLLQEDSLVFVSLRFQVLASFLEGENKQNVYDINTNDDPKHDSFDDSDYFLPHSLKRLTIPTEVVRAIDFDDFEEKKNKFYQKLTDIILKDETYKIWKKEYVKGPKINLDGSLETE